MEEEIICPNCHSRNIKKKVRKETLGLGRGRIAEDDPQKEEFISYECECCGKEFAEEDMYE